MRAPIASGIARVAYEATRAYAGLLGHEEGPVWLAASPGQRMGALAGALAVLSGEARSGAHLHALWLRRPGAGTSAGAPAAVPAPPYEQLTIVERRRILLFRAVVLALVDGPCNGDCHDERCPLLDDHDCHLDTCMSRFGVPPGLWPARDPNGALHS